MRTGALLGLVAAMAISLTARADTAVIPAANATVPGGTGANTLLRDSGEPRTLQMVIGSGLLSEIPVGSFITGITWRLQPDGGPSFPPAGMSFAQYDIQLASSLNSPGGLSTTFANNVNVDAVTVRTGSLNVNASDYPGGASAPNVNAWGLRIVFTTPYLWTGTNLLITIRHPGSSLTLNEFVDSLPAGTAGLQCQTALTDNAVTATSPNTVSPIFRLDFVPPTAVTKIYIPALLDNTEGSTNFQPMGAFAAHTIQMVIGARELAAIPRGSRISGITWRLNGGQAAWPVGGATWPQFDIQLSRSNNPPGSMDALIASNTGLDATTVRSGPLSLPSNALPGGETPNDFGVTIPFTTPYLYNGGDLHMVVRHSAVPGVNGLFDAAPAGTADIQCGFTFNTSAATSTSTNSTFPVTRFTVLPAIVSPTGLEITDGGVSNFALLQSIGVTYQAILGPEELAHIPVGSSIDGLSWRLTPNGQPSFPAGVDAWYSDFDIRIAPAPHDPITMSTTFASNVGAGEVQVRAGPLVIPVGAFTGLPAATVNPWGPVIRFDGAYAYTGGSLVVTIRHTGHNRGAVPSDALPTNGPGYGDRFKSVFAAGFNLPSGGVTNYTALRLSFTPSTNTPRALETADGNGATGGAFLHLDQTCQIVFSANELASIPVGSTINGVSYRRNATFNNTPPRDLPFAAYRIQLSTSPTTPATMSTTFASNIGADVVTVYDAALAVPAATHIGGGLASPAAQPNFTYVGFTRPFTYAGGPLSMTLRFTGATGGADDLVVDGLTTGGAGYGTAIKAAFGNGMNALTGVFSTAPIARLAFTPPRCPADYNGDGFVDGIDADQFNNDFEAGNPRADFNADGFVDGIDADLFNNAFDAGC